MLGSVFTGFLVIGAAIVLAVASQRRFAAGYPVPPEGLAILHRGEAAFLQAAAEVLFPDGAALPVVGADAQDTVVRLQMATELRGAGLACTPDLTTRRLGKQLEGAVRAGAHFAVICGDEMEEGHVQLRDLKAGTQRQVAVADLARELLRAQAQHRHGGDG